VDGPALPFAEERGNPPKAPARPVAPALPAFPASCHSQPQPATVDAPKLSFAEARETPARPVAAPLPLLPPSLRHPNATPARPQSNQPKPAMKAGNARKTAPPPEPASKPTLAEEEPKTKPVIHVRGRIQADTIIVNQSTRNREIIGEIQDATGFRRARLG